MGSSVPREGDQHETHVPAVGLLARSCGGVRRGGWRRDEVPL